MESEHIVSRYDAHFARINSDIQAMGVLVAEQLSKATEALTEFDAEAVDQLIATDRRINAMQQNVYTESERLIALRQPMALDLRKALSPINIAAELERIGDHAKSTAKGARKLAATSVDATLLGVLLEMSSLVQVMLLDALTAFRESDTALAADIRARDLEIDQMNKAVFAKAVQEMDGSKGVSESYMRVVLLARGFERVGDHVVNITRHIHKIVTGEDLKASS